MMTKAKAEELARTLRQYRPDLEAEIAAIEALVLQASVIGQEDGLPIRGTLSLKVEKFDGDYQPGMVPVETIESVHSL